jgi:DNA-binding FrmR family transcriptional regulator
MKITNVETRDALIRRLNRIEGQVRGVENMLLGERDCREIMQQLAAIHSAVQSTSRIFLQDYATACLVEVEKYDGSKTENDMQMSRQQIVQDMIRLLDKTP